MAQALHAAGYTITEVAGRHRRRAEALARKVGSQAATPETARWDSDVVWIAVSDDAIAGCAAELAKARSWKGVTVLHSAGALASDVLRPLKRRGAAVASLHPMMSFVAGRQTDLRDVWFAVEGDAAAVRVALSFVKAVGGRTLKIAKDKKALYHAFGAMVSPLIVSQLRAAEGVAAEAGIRARDAQQIMHPIVERTIANYFAAGAQAAFSGPMLRGDVKTIEKHLRSLRGDEAEVYRTLARYAVKKLKVGRKRELEKLLR